MKRDEQNVVYLITDGELCKIGITKHLDKRFAQIQASCGREIRLLSTYNVDTNQLARLIETKLHEAFADRRTYGEWFAMAVSTQDFQDLCRDYHDVSIGVVATVSEDDFVNALVQVYEGRSADEVLEDLRVKYGVSDKSSFSRFKHRNRSNLWDVTRKFSKEVKQDRLQGLFMGLDQKSYTLFGALKVLENNIREYEEKLAEKECLQAKIDSLSESLVSVTSEMCDLLESTGKIRPNSRKKEQGQILLQCGLSVPYVSEVTRISASSVRKWKAAL